MIWLLMSPGVTPLYYLHDQFDNYNIAFRSQFIKYKSVLILLFITDGIGGAGLYDQ